MISIVNYGIGNIGSVANMLRHLGQQSVFASTVEDIEAATALILPGVGAFDFAMETLRQKQFVEPLRHQALVRKVPMLGICLGMQLLANGSEEGDSEGLGLIDATFVKFAFPPESGLKVPHMGWNALRVVRDNPLIDRTEAEQRFYFVHSYHARVGETPDVIATADHGGEFVAAYGRDNIYGVQFHPEKSHKFGMALLKNFATRLC
jgi:glutamine amidotransferase